MLQWQPNQEKVRRNDRDSTEYKESNREEQNFEEQVQGQGY